MISRRAWLMSSTALSAAAQTPQTPSARKTLEGQTAGQGKIIAGVPLRWCPAGGFRMGSPLNEPMRRPDEDQVNVTLTRGFWIGQHEITQEQWLRIAGPFPRPMNKGVGEAFPVHWVSYLEAEAFCERLTALGRAANHLDQTWECKLPTEAQWEYACRAGSSTATSFGASLSRSQANFNGEPYNGGSDGPSHGIASTVGSYPANAWGIYDMHGNIFEWCRDWYHAKLPGGLDPDLSKLKGVMNRDGTYSRVRRGGAWNDPGAMCRSALRLRYEPERRSDHIGFRVVAVKTQPTETDAP